ncbi:TonB-dependent siderophore receptor [Mucilaginibacter gynuensis]|uniref:TonB-dependent siderophore receptor n=1 Tax=Mucilaginibacter gynuensis TaxID=1302236 RepID=A0ABP8G8B8_9SPHI
MKKLLTLFISIVLGYSTFAQQQNGTVSGEVTTREGSAAPYVTVGVKGSADGTLTNDKGHFRLTRLKPGTYTISVSAVNLTPQEQQVTVTAGKNTELNFVLDINTSQLQEVIVNSHSNRIKMDNPSQSLRLQEPLIEIPQNIQVVSTQALKEQQIISLSDGLIRNVSGAVRLEHWGDLYTNINMRGSQIQAFRNGFNVVSSFWGPLTEDMSFVDHIEFVKGPSGFMLSNGDPSGLYNVVTKKPTGETKGEVSFTTGSFNLYRATADLDGKLSKNGKLLYRLNLAAQKKKSFRANEFNDRYSVAPVLSYQVDDKTKITAEYIYQRANTSDVGSYYVFSPKGYAALPRNFSPLPPDLPTTKINDHSFTLNMQNQLSSNWKLTTQAAYYNYHQDGTSMWADTVAPDSRYIRNAGIWEAKSTMKLGQIFVNGKVTTGFITHKILAGVDAANKKYAADYAQTFALDTEDQMFDPQNPNNGTPSNGYPVYDRSQDLNTRAAAGFGIIDSKYSSLYIQDELGFLDNKLRLTLAGRYTYVKQASFGSEDEAKHFTPRVGVSYSINEQTSVYGLYDQAFVPQSGKLRTGTVKPLTGSNIEFGIKKDWADGKWNTTVSVYSITKNNELTSDPTAGPNEGLSIVFGKKRAKGIEFDLRGELLPGLDLTANYALTDSRIIEVAPGVTESTGMKKGDIVPAYAKHVANAWLTYKLRNGVLKNSGIAGGFTYYGDRHTNDTFIEGQQKLPTYFKLDGGLFWDNGKIRVAGNVFNILDKYLYSGSYYTYLSSYYYQAEAPRNFRLSVNYRF